MNERDVADLTVVGGLGFGSAYLNFISTYGTALITTLAIMVAVVTLVLRVQEFIGNLREDKEDRPNVGRNRKK